MSVTLSSLLSLPSFFFVGVGDQVVDGDVEQFGQGVYGPELTPEMAEAFRKAAQARDARKAPAV